VPRTPSDGVCRTANDAPMTEQTLVAATGNPHKLDEIRSVLAELGIVVLGLADAGGPFPEPDEIGETFQANATIKARAYAAATGRACLADDSGLEIDALGGRPGVISSHYAADGEPDARPRAERDAANNARVLSELKGVPDEARSARFVCCMVVCAPSGDVLHIADGVFKGRIGTPPRVPAGGQGFGYDPLFLVSPDHTRTAAELDSAEKAAISHRGAALRALVERMRSSA